MFHLIFKINMDLTWKSRFVDGGNLVNLTQIVIYPRIMYRDTFSIIMAIMVLNVLDISFYEIVDTYLQRWMYNKVYIISGKSIGEDISRRDMVVVRELYVIKSRGDSSYNHLACILMDQRFIICLV